MTEVLDRRMAGNSSYWSFKKRDGPIVIVVVLYDVQAADGMNGAP